MNTFRKRMVVVAVYLALLALYGCATTSEPIVRVEVREVEVPVLVRCIDAEKIEQPPKTSMDPKGDTKQLAAGAAADVLELEAYAERLRTRLLECAR
jgi:hypothetical protein